MLVVDNDIKTTPIPNVSSLFKEKTEFDVFGQSSST